jgi:hypothetical protein
MLVALGIEGSMARPTDAWSVVGMDIEGDTKSWELEGTWA